MTVAVCLLLLLGKAAWAIEYNEPGAVQKFGQKGWLIEAGNDHGIRFRAYLETKQLLVAEDGIYYIGSERVEGIDGEPNGTIRWSYRARCAVRPDLKGKIAVGIYVSGGADDSERFTEIANSDPANAERGWYGLWWAACRNIIKKF
jgi:hypothetical protein